MYMYAPINLRLTADWLLACCADTFHKPGFKMHARILHHLFSVASGDVVKAPLWDVAAKGGSRLHLVCMMLVWDSAWI